MNEEKIIETNETPEVEKLTDDQSKALDELTPDFQVKVKAEEEKTSKKQTESIMMMGLLLTGVFEVLAVRLGDHWRLDQREASAIAEPAIAVIDKYVPNFENGPELALVAATAMVVVPRVMAQQQIREGGNNGDQSEPQSH